MLQPGAHPLGSTEFRGWASFYMSFTGGSDGKESAYGTGDLGSVPGLGRSPGGGHAYPLQCSCLENSIERSLVSYSPWGSKELDMAEPLSLSFLYISMSYTCNSYVSTHAYTYLI